MDQWYRMAVLFTIMAGFYHCQPQMWFAALQYPALLFRVDHIAGCLLRCQTLLNSVSEGVMTETCAPQGMTKQYSSKVYIDSPL